MSTEDDDQLSDAVKQLAPAMDRMAVVDAMTKAATELGWVPISADSSARMITIIVRPRP